MNKTKISNILFEIMRTAIAILISLLIAVVIIFLSSKQPWQAIDVFLTAPFSSTYEMGKILYEATPLIFTGVAICLMIKAGQFNMIGEGTFYAGGLIGAVLAVTLHLPGIMLPLSAMLLAGILSGAVGYVPAKLKASFKVNEFVSSLMLNFIIYWVCFYLLGNRFTDIDYPGIATKMIPDAAKLPFLSFDNEISSSIIIGVIVVIAVWFLLYQTRWGYKIRMTGSNEKFANYCGMNTKRSIISSQVIGAAICGFGGAAFILGNFYRFTWLQLPGYGFDGFIIAILARNNPLLVPLAALFIGYLRTGAMEMSRSTDVTNEVVFLIQAIMIILIAAEAFLSRWKQKRLQKSFEKEGQKADA